VKRAFIVFLVIALIFAFASCSGSEESIEAAPPPASPPQEETLPRAAEETPLPEIEPILAEEVILPDLVVHVLDVGQADSILIQLPNRQAMLIDGGNDGDESAITNYMGSLNITAIDYLVATHPHADHIGGLPAIIDSMDIGEIYMPRISHNTRTFERLLNSIDNKGLQINTAKAGLSILSESDLRIDVIAPVKDTYNDINEYSAVVKIIYGDTAFLFMGDAGTSSEGQIIADVSADVLKVGHHGSRSSTSQAFLTKVAPIYAVISAGMDNSYGHPTDEILSRLNDANVGVYRTDLQGTVVFTSDGSKVTANKEPSPYKAPTPLPAPEPVPAAAPSPTAKQEAANQGPGNDVVMVWLSATGSKYHRINNCGSMNPDKATQVPLELAKNSYEPCGKCNPPG